MTLAKKEKQKKCEVAQTNKNKRKPACWVWGRSEQKRLGIRKVWVGLGVLHAHNSVRRRSSEPKLSKKTQTELARGCTRCAKSPGKQGFHVQKSCSCAAHAHTTAFLHTVIYGHSADIWIHVGFNSNSVPHLNIMKKFEIIPYRNSEFQNAALQAYSFKIRFHCRYFCTHVQCTVCFG